MSSSDQSDCVFIENYKNTRTWDTLDNVQKLSQSKSKSKVKSQKNLELLFSIKLKSDSLVKIKLKIQFQNSILDCDKVESNSSFYWKPEIECLIMVHYWSL